MSKWSAKTAMPFNHLGKKREGCVHCIEQLMDFAKQISSLPCTR